MDRIELASRLAAADEIERADLLARHAGWVGIELARALKTVFDDNESSEPERAFGAAAALRSLASVTDEPDVRGLAAWTAGMAAQLNGQLEESITQLDSARAVFTALGQAHTAAATQVSKLITLAMLGRYDEAIASGMEAREVFLSEGDLLAAGKIEQNLGNIYHRRDQYAEAERFLRVARERFLALNDQKQLAQVDNCLAIELMWQHKFRAAARLYEQALALAESAHLTVTQAEIECNLGELALFQGQYDRALDYLERSRRRYASLGMPHESAIAELELADAYLELNLAPEAAAIYARIAPTFAGLGLRAEQARALAYHGRACLLLGQIEQAHALLMKARPLYAAEGNIVGEAIVSLADAQIQLAEGNYSAAAKVAAQTEAVFAKALTWGWSLMAGWLHGEALRKLGQHGEAWQLLEATGQLAQRHNAPQVAQRCHTSLGLLAASEGDLERAEASFKQAIELIEKMRAPLPAEEFRVAFVADKLTPYMELVRICLADSNRIVEALGYLERARARALIDILGGALRSRAKARDDFEAELLGQLQELHEELNWFYTQINRQPDSEQALNSAAIEELHTAVFEREARVLEITRQIQQRSQMSVLGGMRAAPLPLLSHVEALDIAQIQRELAAHTAVVEYFSLDEELLAFVITQEKVEVVRNLGHEDQIAAVIAQIHFQIGAFSYGTDHLRPLVDELTSRVRYYLSTLYDMLLKPIEPQLGARRLVVIPHRMLHYVPFHALCDETGYVIQRREVCYAPSVSVLHHCLARPQRSLERALLLGIPDARTPHVHAEISALAPLFSQSVALLDEQATLAALREHAPDVDLLHLACHGHFRPDNPLFSSLRLADGWLTVRDVYDLDLQCALVTLGACETGVNMVAPGDELIGLARGFFSAGAPSLLVSLWMVHDESTAQLMVGFYERLRAGENPAAALRHAQCAMLELHPHPFFWSPFVLFGRW
jgi:CHAT domain-containing protein